MTTVAADRRPLAGASGVQRACYLVAALLALSGLVHLGILVVSGDSWSGPLSWRKPATFGLSFGITLATITWVSGFVRLGDRARLRLLVAFAAACTGEVVVISLQRWRGLPSHFIPSGAPGPVANGLVGGGAAAGAVVIVVVSAALTVAAFRPDPAAPADLLLAVRAGFASFLVALAVGVLMLARGMVLARSGDVAAAFAFSGGFKPGHAATMHGVLVLPLLARLLARTGRDEASRTSVVRVAVAGYVLFAGVVVVECAAGIDPLAPGASAAPLVATGLAALGALVLAGAGVAGLAGPRG